jgi:hypothetical protein
MKRAAKRDLRLVVFLTSKPFDAVKNHDKALSNKNHSLEGKNQRRKNMKIKCLLLTALLLAVTTIGFARSKAATVASNVIVKNLSAAQKAERFRSLSSTTFSQTSLIQMDDERAGSADTLNGKVYVVSIFLRPPSARASARQSAEQADSFPARKIKRIV